MIYPAISIWAPWAEYIAAGLKSIETRRHQRFACLVGKRIAIHQAYRIDTGASAAIKYLIVAGRSAAGRECVMASYQNPGAVVCTAYVFAAHLLAGSNSQAALCDCSNQDRYGLFLQDIQRLRAPFFCKGRQGIFNVEIPDEKLS